MLSRINPSTHAQSFEDLHLLWHTFQIYFHIRMSWYCGQSTGWIIWVLISVTGKRLFSFPKHPDQLWGPPNLLFNGYWQFFPPRVKVGGWDTKLATHLHLVLRLQISGDIHLRPPYACMVCIGATLPPTIYSSFVKIIITEMCYYITLIYYTVLAVTQHLFLTDLCVGGHRLP
jgi:hypothetical protein